MIMGCVQSQDDTINAKMFAIVSTKVIVMLRVRTLRIDFHLRISATKVEKGFFG